MYDGDWMDGKKEGKDKYTSASGSVYEGEWKAGEGGQGQDDLCERKNLRRRVEGQQERGQWHVHLGNVLVESDV